MLFRDLTLTLAFCMINEACDLSMYLFCGQKMFVGVK